MSKENNQATRKIFGVILPAWIDEKVLAKIVYGFLGLVAAILISIVFVWPKFKDMARLEAELKNIQSTNESLKKTNEYVQNLGSRLDENKLSEVKIAMPKTYDLGLILAGLEKTAFEAGVVFDSYSFEGGTIGINDKPSGVFKQHKLQVTMVGGSEKLIRFIDLLQSSLPFSVVTELSLSEVSRLFSLQGVTKLELQLSYFESSSPVVKFTEIRDFTPGEIDLLNKLPSYLKPNPNDNFGPSGVIKRQEGIFGF